MGGRARVRLVHHLAYRLAAQAKRDGVCRGGEVAEKGGTAFLPEDFKKREGFKLSVARAKELGLYRQSYCGCEFSRH